MLTYFKKKLSNKYRNTRDVLFRNVVRALASVLIAAKTSNTSNSMSTDERAAERAMMLAGVQAVRAGRSQHSIQSLADVEVSVFSQFGEDGILDWLIEQIPNIPTKFIEFGVGNYRESNTRFLLKNRNWRGLVIEGHPQSVEKICGDDVHFLHDLTALNAFITAENISQLISDAGFRTNLGLLSVDIDGNDFWVLEKLQHLNPPVIVCEYNATFGDRLPLSIPYDPSFDRTAVQGTSRLYYGASIQAFVSLLKGYTLVGTNTAGNNAFFVQNEHFEKLKTRIAVTTPRPSLFRESYDTNGQLSFIGGLKRLAQIEAMPVIDTVTGERKSLGEIHRERGLYSEEWLNIITG